MIDIQNYFQYSMNIETQDKRCITGGRRMFDLLGLNFDFDSDGIPDSHAEYLDTNGDGIPDSIMVDTNQDGIEDTLLVDSNHDGNIDMICMDTNGDGSFDMQMVDTDHNGTFETQMIDSDHDGVFDTVGVDTNNDGIIDSYRTQLDTDHDGKIDTYIEGNDYNQDGVIESQVTYRDKDQDGNFEDVEKAYDSNGDGVIDTIKTFVDLDGSGNPGMVLREEFLDRDGDGRIDTYVFGSDTDHDGVFEAVEVYDYHPENGSVELTPLSSDSYKIAAGCNSDELGNFDPAKADPNAVVGDPSDSMKVWEFQGDTGRCALFAQKFVFEELKHQEIDIEKLADLAEENGWFNEDSGTPLLNMDKALHYLDIDSKMTFHNDIQDIEECLQSGGKIIVSIDADEIWYGENDSIFTPGEGPNHAVQVIGIDRTDADNPMVILNDSGSPNGCGEMVPMDVFLDAWEDGNCQMISCY